MGRRQGGEEPARAASADGSPLPRTISCSVLEVTSLSSSDMSSTEITGGGDRTFGRTGGGDMGLAATGGGVGADRLGEAPMFLVVRRGVAGVVEKLGITAGAGA